MSKKNKKWIFAIIVAIWILSVLALMTAIFSSSMILRSRLADRTCIIIFESGCLISMILGFLAIFLAITTEGDSAYKGYSGNGISERKPLTMAEITYGIHYNYEGWENDSARCSDDAAEGQWNAEHKK